MAKPRNRKSAGEPKEKGHRFGLSRPTGIRSTLPVIVIACDDSKTAVRYFEALRGIVKGKATLTIVRNSRHNISPKGIVKKANEKLTQLKRDSDQHGGERTSAWALIDREARPHLQEEADAAKKCGDKRGINVVLSNPCYEVWTLLHLEDTGQLFSDCTAVLNRIKTKWKRVLNEAFDTKKAQADYSKLLKFVSVACKRARHHHEAGDPSWTEVYKLIEEIEKYGPLTTRSSHPADAAGSKG